MKKIFVNPNVKVLSIETSVNILAASTIGVDTQTKHNGIVPEARQGGGIQINPTETEGLDF